MNPDNRYLYRTMQVIRTTEEQLARCHARALVLGACHTYVGQEAVAAGVCSHLRTDDVVFSTHRGHGTRLERDCLLSNSSLSFSADEPDAREAVADTCTCLRLKSG